MYSNLFPWANDTFNDIILTIPITKKIIIESFDDRTGPIDTPKLPAEHSGIC